MRPILLAVLLAAAAPAAAAPSPAPAKVVVLGVDHAVQLVAEHDQPGMLAAFVERVAPDAICVERAPDKFARGDHYEFTYEIQDVLVPLARARGIALCPFDWEPPKTDAVLGWGFDLEALPELRQPSGYQGFLSFPQPRSLRRTLFHAEDRAALAEIEAWITTPAPRAGRDLPRRMFLYRTFLQARQVAAAARQHPGGTVLVVVGEFHKHDIEAVLADEPGIEVVAPSSWPAPTLAEAERATSRAQRFAIASFNLLGAQAASGSLDLDWIGRVLDALEADGGDAGTALLRVRHARLAGRIDGAAAIARYAAIAADPDARRDWAWNGVLDRSRVDSYFDPFGNLRIDQRAQVEIAREAAAAGDDARAAAALAAAREGLSPRKARQLDGYFARESEAGAAR